MAEGELFHASCVASGERAVLILGKSGAGKSSLALHLMALGCTLVADDGTFVDAELMATCPATITGTIEARGVGLLKAESTRAKVVLVVDLDRIEKDRLPPKRSHRIAKNDVPLIFKVESIHFPFAILQYLKGTGFAEL